MSNLNLTIFTAAGALPNSQVEMSFPIITTNGTTFSGVLTWTASGESSKNIVSIAAYGEFSPFDCIQCTIQWIPTRFNVMVNVTNQTIIVDPLETLETNDLDKNR